MRADVQRMLARADVRVGPVIGYEKASDFLLLLRPAWWVLRGYIAAMALAYLIENDRGDIGLLPRIAGNDLVALVLLAGCVIASILLGRRTPMLSRWPRYALWSGTAVLVLFALSTFMSADSDTRHPSYDQVNGSYDSNPYSNIGDVFVYDSQGRLVTGARLYDQDGSPIQLGNNYCTDPTTGDSNRTRALGYPFCPQDAPFGPSPSAPAPTPSDPSAADPSLTATPTSPAASPTATATSPASSAASASARVSPTATPSR
jgi:hypothetical protein